MSELEPVPPKLTRSLAALILIFSVVLSFTVGVFTGEHQGTNRVDGGNSAAQLMDGDATAPQLSSDVNFAQFWQVWNILKNRYYQQPLSDQDLYYGAVKGLVASVNDPYTIFMDPTEAKAFGDNLDGTFDGIGAEIGMKDNQLEIIAPLPNTPAAQAGLMAGDVITAIDKVSTQTMGVDEVVSKIRGAQGTQVTLTIRRGKLASKDYTITRQTITVKSVTMTMDGGIATITISIFGPDTSQLFSQAVTDALNQNAKGVILDLRGDPGGVHTAAIDVASAWVGTQPVVMEKGPGIAQTYDGTFTERLADIPTVVLVDGGSASASEIVSGALQDYGLATLVGTQTFGKGSVQDLINLSDGSEVKVTIAEWNTPKGRSINKVGITPDVVLPITDQDLHDKRDVQKEKAIQIINAKLAAK